MDKERAHTFLSMVIPDLERVREIFLSLASSSDSVVERIGGLVRENAGKMLRPALMLLSHRMLDGDGAGRVCRDREAPSGPVLRLAAVIELLHTATLVHDDVIDEADMRRGSPSLNALCGNEVSVLAGDWCYITALQAAVELRNFQVLDILLDVVRRMVEGELIQLDFIGRIDITREESLDIASRKTAHLFSSCTRLAGVLRGRGPEEIESLFRIGFDLGMAFQLMDDVLDFTAAEAKLGKPIMNDLREGKVTLPVIHLLEGGDPGHRRLVETVLAEKDFRTVRAEEFRNLLNANGCIARTVSLAETYIHSGKACLNAYPPSPCRDALLGIADFILTRGY